VHAEDVSERLVFNDRLLRVDKIDRVLDKGVVIDLLLVELLQRNE